MRFNQCLGFSYNLWAKDHGKNGQRAEAHQASAEDSQQKRDWLHLKYSGGEDKQLERRRRREHGRHHQGKKFLLFKTVTDALELGFVEALEQEQFAAGAAQAVRNQAAQR